MSRKPRLFLLDAGPVVRLHELGLWDTLLRRAHVVLPSVVVSEVQYWESPDGPRRIDLGAAVAEGHLQVVEAEAVEVERTRRRFDPSISDAVHPGELEALTLLRCWEDSSPDFCCADRLATIAACLLGFADLVISFEELLSRVGLGRAVTPPWYTEREMGRWLEEGRRRRLTGEGLDPSFQG